MHRGADRDEVRQLQQTIVHCPGNRQLTFVPEAAVGNSALTSGLQKPPWEGHSSQEKSGEPAWSRIEGELEKDGVQQKTNVGTVKEKHIGKKLQSHFVYISSSIITS